MKALTQARKPASKRPGPFIRRSRVSEALFSVDVKKARKPALRRFVRTLGRAKVLSKPAQERLQLARRQLRK